ncbi:acriflavin resistance protein [Thermincola ferriacetica]|uniref:Acriflavin resistance protein n=1 Tax=Thermincola ferriacetica TaxID=281456 RepID=A0A0L6VZZ9_9FIRM|nr:acriflavin resistance protein [Thermincola ferriacetica]
MTDDISNELARIPVPDGYSIIITGEQTDLQESMRDLLYSLALAILAVYLLLVSHTGYRYGLGFGTFCPFGYGCDRRDFNCYVVNYGHSTCGLYHF